MLHYGLNSDHKFIMFVPQRIYTGGETFLAELFSYFRRQEVAVEPIYLERPQRAKHGLLLMFDILFANGRLFFQVKRLGKSADVVLFEDFSLHPRLWIFNKLMWLTTERLRVITLVQSSLRYRHAVRNQIVRLADKLVMRSFFRQASLVLTNSEFTRREVLSAGVPSEKVHVIYCGWSGHLSLQPERQQSSPTSRLLFVGQCTEDKGLEYLIQAMQLLSDVPVTLHLVGKKSAESSYQARLDALVAESDLEDRVIFHGHVAGRAQLTRFYEDADIFVLPSLVEGFGIVLLEAMSYGLPIVATTGGSIPELVTHGTNGLLVPPADPLALALAIRSLLNSPLLRKQYGQAGFGFVADHRAFYLWDTVGARALRAMRPLLRPELAKAT